MKNKSICEQERSHLEKMNRFQLSHKFKKIGGYVVLIAFLLMIAKKFVDEPIWVKPVLRNIFVLGLLLVSLAKDKIEDEFIDSLRSQSYRIAFILGVVYAIVQPQIEYAVDYLIDGDDATNGFSYFQVLVFMLVVQIAVFYQLKRYNR
ncbi:hypothetical protein AAON49_07635 [Pseudotenacibaculum sp. MALMAid0570]|uniref:hypothetical protein n=1 Tax=Pseudotenacibaculum sp. MALMAid0570 TaxID=3143938 RepID=UPI0032DFCB02